MNKQLGAVIGSWIARIMDAWAIVTATLVTVLMLFLVVARYLLGLSVVGLHELIMLAALQMYMVGAIIASRRGDHLVVEFLAQRLSSPRARALHGMFVALVTIVVCAFFILWSYRMFAWGIQRPQTTPAYGIPLWIPQFAIMVAAVGCFLYAIRDFIAHLRHLRG